MSTAGSSAVTSFFLAGLSLLLSACSQIVYSPGPVVPTKQPLPYSAKLTVAHVGTYLVKPGATMSADPRLSNHVTGETYDARLPQRDWEQAILRYLDARKTFAQVSTRGPADLELTLHVNVYIDPGVLFQYRHIYMARVDATVGDPQSHLALQSYTGQGKAFGEVSRDGPEDDRDPINLAVQMALNDLFGKMEQDAGMRRL
jgi:hypothetical protein